MGIRAGLIGIFIPDAIFSSQGYFPDYRHPQAQRTPSWTATIRRSPRIMHRPRHACN
jgi:hypothetical protein